MSVTQNRFYKNLGPFTLGKIAEIIDVQLPESKNNILIHGINNLQSSNETELTVLSNAKYTNAVHDCKAKACLVPQDFVSHSKTKPILLKVANPYYAYALLVDLFYEPMLQRIARLMPSAYVDESARIGNNCYIGHNVVIEAQAEIGDDSVIEAGSFIGHGVKIGKRAKIDAHVSISYACIGDDVRILPGARIGQDGFGFATNKGIHKKIYHIGKVIIGNDVEIGANSTIDRGSVSDTIIEDFCRVDNLVQIGHNVHVKKGTILVSQVGIAGSSVIGAYCALGGQVGVAGHVTIADNVQIAGQGGVVKDITEPGVMGGTPAVPIRQWHKQTLLLGKLVSEKYK